ncbi:accessory protein NosL [Leptospira levettii]|uniref:nitrous oxide reductase accessory protein NosL n=1 Tax=Leptospira levettii TaxID=2023178 RepID=UPI000C29D41A|nr:nitrous oxide reductase accessory protein NosL [Leptospira levettii]MCW7473921.1 nitrous oxide reductase accessory protein NosL [Leptospira levettii]PJZ38277.1 accessory protein NosL [Leptospira levettii]PJZ87802.1 accessory protein NosL [Leptospira levettii]PKA00974.1 accessory protein NosL [Leptospira levettii]
MWFKLQKLVFFTLTVVLCNCGEVKPEALTVGEKKCDHCSMSIVDMRFHTQIITYKGKRFHFDAIECANKFINQKQIKPKQIWVSNYLQSNESIPKENAIIIQTNKIRSPMGGGLAAFKSHEDAIPFQN